MLSSSSNRFSRQRSGRQSGSSRPTPGRSWPHTDQTPISTTAGHSAAPPPPRSDASATTRSGAGMAPSGTDGWIGDTVDGLRDAGPGRTRMRAQRRSPLYRAPVIRGSPCASCRIRSVDRVVTIASPGCGVGGRIVSVATGSCRPRPPREPPRRRPGQREVLGTEVLEDVVVVTLAGGLPWTSHWRRVDVHGRRRGGCPDWVRFRRCVKTGSLEGSPHR